MGFLRFIYFTLLVGVFTVVYSQERAVAPERTPEQEAARQTEKLHQELQLSPDQARKIYEINLKYARFRKESNTRSESVKRIRDKEHEIMNLLDNKQRTNLQNKRYERSSFQSPSVSNQSPTDMKTDNNNRASNAELKQSKTDSDNSRVITPSKGAQAQTKGASKDAKKSSSNQQRR
jgi:hypothetical protein